MITSCRKMNIFLQFYVFYYRSHLGTAKQTTPVLIIIREYSSAAYLTCTNILILAHRDHMEINVCIRCNKYTNNSFLFPLHPRKVI